MFICNKLTSPILSNNQTPRFITTKHRKFINSGTMVPNSHPTIIRLLKILFLLSRYRRRFKHDSLQFSAMIVDIILGNLMYRIHKNTQKNTCKWLNKFYHFYQKYKKSISLQSIMILLNNCIQNHLLVLKFMQFGWPQQKCSYNTFLLVCSLDPFLQRKTTSLSFVKSKSWGRSNQDIEKLCFSTYFHTFDFQFIVQYESISQLSTIPIKQQLYLYQDSIESKQKNVLKSSPTYAECISQVYRVQKPMIFLFWKKSLIFLILLIFDCVVSNEWTDWSQYMFLAISVLFDVVIVVFSSYHDCNFYWNMERNFLKEEIIHNYTHYNVFQEQKNHSGCEYDSFQKVDENNNSIQIKQRWRGYKILRKRTGTIIHDIIRTPNPFNHVYNLFNAVSINQRSLRDNMHDQSYFSSIFYVNKVEKVEIRKNAIIVFLQNIQQKNIPVQYFLQRLQSFGDKEFLILAENIRRASRQFTKVGWKEIKQQYSGQPLSRFIQSMQGRAYACKVAPNKLVISKALIEILEQDLQLFALKISKYGFPKEIISAENYREVMNQAMINLEMASKYAMDGCELQELVSSTGIQFDDYVYAKGKKVKGRFLYWMPTPIINCVEFKGKIGEYEWDGGKGHVDEDRKNRIEEAVQIVRMREAETLQHLTTVSSSSLRRNKERVAGFRCKQISH